MNAQEVRFDEPREAPVPPQDLCNQELALGGKATIFLVSVYRVKRTHDYRRIGKLDRRLKGGQVNFTKRPLVRDDVDESTVNLLIV